jgi:hypothetical protein
MLKNSSSNVSMKLSETQKLYAYHKRTYEILIGLPAVKNISEIFIIESKEGHKSMS